MCAMRRRVYDPGESVEPVAPDMAEVARGLEPQIENRREDVGPVNRDARWHCTKCGYLLGFYDLKDDVLRTRYKEHIVFVRCGEGGFVQVVCRGCAEVNTATGDSAPGDTADPAG